MMLSSSTGKQVDAYRSQTGAQYPVYASDETALKTAMRSNIGLMLLYNGTIIGIWSGCDLPEDNSFKGDILGKQLHKMEYSQNKKDVMLLIGGILLIGLLLLLSRCRY